MTEYRARFDARVEFANGGGLGAEGFRIDLPSPDVTEADVARLFVGHLGLALVSTVSVSNLVIAQEQHRGTRGVESPPTAPPGRLVDLSHTIRAGLITYPGLPAPVITPHLTREQSIDRYAPGTQFAMDIITMIGNTGTYLDSPFHRFEGGDDLADLDLATLVDQPAEVFHLQDVSARGIPAEVFLDRDLAGTAVLLHTGWSSRFGTPGYATGAPFLSAEGASHLAEAGVTLVGIDSLNIDDTEGGGERPAHTTLLRSGIHVVEHLTNLAALPPSGSSVTAVPPKVEGFGTFPVRVFARVL
ncbi:cyclase family protein [Lacisediminihabitans sp.]|uniref:cyclase family protein n=1 Tax=Lacisediminihabitans sp. TaxID=2787631 RepID=UPI00374C9CA4